MRIFLITFCLFLSFDFLYAQESVYEESLRSAVEKGEISFEDALLTAQDLQSRLACEAFEIDEAIDVFSLRILRFKRALRKKGALDGRTRSRIAALERDAFMIRSFRTQSRAPLAGGLCPYKPPFDTSYLPE